MTYDDDDVRGVRLRCYDDVDDDRRQIWPTMTNGRTTIIINNRQRRRSAWAQVSVIRGLQHGHGHQPAMPSSSVVLHGTNQVDLNLVRI